MITIGAILLFVVAATFFSPGNRTVTCATIDLASLSAIPIVSENEVTVATRQAFKSQRDWLRHLSNNSTKNDFATAIMSRKRTLLALMVKDPGATHQVIKKLPIQDTLAARTTNCVEQSRRVTGVLESTVSDDLPPVVRLSSIISGLGVKGYRCTMFRPRICRPSVQRSKSSASKSIRHY